MCKPASHIGQHGRAVLWGQCCGRGHNVPSTVVNVLHLSAFGPMAQNLSQDLRDQCDNSTGEEAEDDDPGGSTGHFGRDADAGDGYGRRDGHAGLRRARVGKGQGRTPAWCRPRGKAARSAQPSARVSYPFEALKPEWHGFLRGIPLLFSETDYGRFSRSLERLAAPGTGAAG